MGTQVMRLSVWVRKLRLGVKIMSEPSNSFLGILPLWEIYAKAFFFFKAGSHVTQNGLELTMQPRMTLNVWTSRLRFLNSGLTDMCHHTVYVVLTMATY